MASSGCDGGTWETPRDSGEPERLVWPRHPELFPRLRAAAQLFSGGGLSRDCVICDMIY